VLTKLLIFIVFIAASVLAAGLFGAVHDQISYTVSPEYFTRFKFIQFHLVNTDLPERFRAAIVGFKASWWMGIPLGVLCGVAGFMQRTPMQMLRALTFSLAIAVALVLLVALAGLTYGWFQTRSVDLRAYVGWYVPVGLKDVRAFLCAGYMHNAAYLGGVFAIPVVWVFHARFRALHRGGATLNGT
jgi:hypothetical protein